MGREEGMGRETILTLRIRIIRTRNAYLRGNSKSEGSICRHRPTPLPHGNLQKRVSELMNTGTV